MPKRFLFLLVSLAMLMTACTGGQGQPSSGQESSPGKATQAVAMTAEATEPQSGSSTQASPTVAGTAAPVTCTVVSQQPTPGPTEQSLFPPVTEKDWVLGPSTASVTLIVYSDFQCPYCSRVAPILVQIHKDFPEDVRVAFRHLPLIGTPEQPFHDKAALAAQAAEAAGRQDKFWEMHDLLFARQSEWVTQTVSDFQTWLIGRTDELKLDKDRFTTDLTSKEIVDQIQAAWDRGVEINLVSTPSLLVNGQLWPNNLPMSRETLAAVIKLDMMEDRQFTSCPPMTVDRNKQYIATVKTEKGDIVIELLADKAPMAVNNFIFLAREGWYEGATFHRVIPDFVAQGGDPSGTGYGGPGYAFDNETSADLTFDSAGIVAMANAGPGTNGSQFFITYAPAPNLNGGYTIFGKVISGMDVVKKLTPRDPEQNENLPPGDKILSVTIQEK